MIAGQYAIIILIDTTFRNLGLDMLIKVMLIKKHVVKKSSSKNL